MNPNTNAWNRLRYGLYAPFYDVVARRLDRGRRRSIDILGLQPGERVLIPGCGTGLDLEHLSPSVRVTAGDLAPAMVRKTQARADALGLDADIRVMDAHALDLPDNSFDAALLHLILAVVPDPEAAIREVARVLRPGGRVGVFDKFLADAAEPSLVRRAASAVANVIATDLNRRLGPLLDASGLVLEREEPILFGGLFRVALIHKPVSDSVPSDPVPDA
jgi:ubiquinone/menaquinone biosynthesis C-methylase UbiE